MPYPARPRVLVTRAAQQGSALAEHLAALGADPVLVPAIELAVPSSFAALDHALAHLAGYHWLLFTSANAVQAFAARLADLAADPTEGRAGLQSASAAATSPSSPLAASSRLSPLQTDSTRPRIAAIGAATARAVGSLGLAVDLVPPQAVAESLTAALLPHAFQPDGAPTSFLLVRAEEARELLPETLRAAGAEVTVVPAYRTVVPPGSVALLRELFADPARHPHAITFTSASTARNLHALCEAAGVTLPSAALRCSIGPITSQALRDLGLPPHAEAPEATVAALAQTVLEACTGTPLSLLP